jgi:hypothetical protein
MTVKPDLTLVRCIGMTALALVGSSCGEFVRSDPSPVTLVIQALEAAQGNTPAELASFLTSDVLTDNSIFNDVGRVTMRLTFKDPGQPGVTNAPSEINQVTITRYRVQYVRADGRNTPGVDVPFPFDGAVTFTVPMTGIAQAAFELVRHVAKAEPPLLVLRTCEAGTITPVSGCSVISTIAEVTFFGQDHGGNNVTTVGRIGVSFGNFAD